MRVKRFPRPQSRTSDAANVLQHSTVSPSQPSVKSGATCDDPECLALLADDDFSWQLHRL